MTGASGFVGRHVVEALGESFPTSAIWALSQKRKPVFARTNIQMRCLDLSDTVALARLITEVQPVAIVHLAGQASVAAAFTDPWTGWRENVFVCVSLAQAMREAQCNASLVFASSGEVYGDSFAPGVPLDELAGLQPRNSYSRGKVAAEYALQDLLAPMGGKLVIARIFNHIGAGQSEKFVASAFAAQIARIERGLVPPIIKVGNLNVQRDFGHVRDLAIALASVAANLETFDKLSKFNICSGAAVPISYILNYLLSLSTITPTVDVDSTLVRAGEIPVVVGDHSALTMATGWRPKYSLHEALVEVLDDWRRRLQT